MRGRRIRAAAPRSRDHVISASCREPLLKLLISAWLFVEPWSMAK